MTNRLTVEKIREFAKVLEKVSVKPKNGYIYITVDRDRFLANIGKKP